MTPEQKKTLLAVINTLNVVEVKGRQNMNCLLGAIMTLEQMVSNADAPDIKIEEVTPEDEAR